MGMFDIEFQESLNQKEMNKSLYDFVKKQFSKEKDYEIKEENESLTISKCKIDSILKYNLEVSTSINKQNRTSQVNISAELHDTLILTILIIFAIPLTYGIGIIFIVIFTYYQKIKATKYLRNLLQNYKSTI